MSLAHNKNGKELRIHFEAFGEQVRKTGAHLCLHG